MRKAFFLQGQRLIEYESARASEAAHVALLFASGHQCVSEGLKASHDSWNCLYIQHYSFDTMTASAPHVQGGRFKALAQTRMTRTKSFPDLPTMDELGFKNYDASSWYGVSGPSGMPAEIVQMLNEEINAVLAMPDVVERFEGYGVEDGGGSAEKFAGFMQDEYTKWGEVVRVAGVTAEG